MSGHGGRRCRKRWDDKSWAAEAIGVKHNCCCRKRTLLEMALPPWAPLLNSFFPPLRLAMISLCAHAHTANTHNIPWELSRCQHRVEWIGMRLVMSQCCVIYHSWCMLTTSCHSHHCSQCVPVTRGSAGPGALCCSHVSHSFCSCQILVSLDSDWQLKWYYI